MLVCADDVSKTFRRGGDSVYAVNGATLSVGEAETVGLIGESGSGKSTLGRLLLGLLAVDSGTVALDGTELASIRGRELRRLRSDYSIVFQEPLQSLNPHMRAGAIIAEPLVLHQKELGRAERERRVVEVLEQVGLDPAHRHRLPRELSGGQQQRVGIARAVVTTPRFLVLDEPTSSLDQSVRANILNLLDRLQQELQVAYLLISHDITTVRYFCTRTVVMYLGQIVEEGPTTQVLEQPRHPYTRALVSAAMSTERDPASAQRFRLHGDVPSPTSLPTGCPLVGRCPLQIDACSEPVAPREIAPNHRVACLRADEAATPPPPADAAATPSPQSS